MSYAALVHPIQAIQKPESPHGNQVPYQTLRLPLSLLLLRFRILKKFEARRNVAIDTDDFILRAILHIPRNLPSHRNLQLTLRRSSRLRRRPRRPVPLARELLIQLPVERIDAFYARLRHPTPTLAWNPSAHHSTQTYSGSEFALSSSRSSLASAC
jgi:hypothetical protein